MKEGQAHLGEEYKKLLQQQLEVLQQENKQLLYKRKQLLQEELQHAEQKLIQHLEQKMQQNRQQNGGALAFWAQQPQERNESSVPLELRQLQGLSRKR